MKIQVSDTADGVTLLLSAEFSSETLKSSVGSLSSEGESGEPRLFARLLAGRMSVVLDQAKKAVLQSQVEALEGHLSE